MTNTQLRELIRHKKTEPRYTLGEKQVDYILSTIREALPKEKKWENSDSEDFEAGVEVGCVDGYNYLLSDIHQLLGGTK